MPNYQNGKIYEIVCNITGERYIGSTTLILSQRLAEHRNLKSKCSSKIIIQRNDYYINLLESCPCNNKDELRMYERKWFDNLHCINQVKPFISHDEKKIYDKEYQIQNADKIKQQRKQYYIENADKIKQQMKEYRLKNKFKQENSETIIKENKYKN